MVKSLSSTNLTLDSGLGNSCKELSRSLDYLDVNPPSLPTDGRRKSKTLPNFPSPQLDSFKKLSLGTAFGTKKITLGRKLSSIMSVPTERYLL